MRTMSDPFEPSDAPRLITPQELALMIRMSRAMRSWSQEDLAAEANVTVRTVQRVESGKPTDRQTRRALARAFGAQDFDVFSKPVEFLSPEQYAEKHRQEEETRKRDFLELPLRETDSRALVELSARVGAFYFSRTSTLTPPTEAERLIAELQDYIHDCVDIADDIGATERLDLAEHLKSLLKNLYALGMTLRVAERNTALRFQNGQTMKLAIGYVVVCPKGREPKTVWAPKKLN